MRNNLFFYTKILLMILMLSCSASKTEEDAELQNTVEAAMIGVQSNDNEESNIENDAQIYEQQNFDEQQEGENNTLENNEVTAENNNSFELNEFDEIAGQQDADDFSVGQNAVDQQSLEQQEEGFGEQFEQSNEQIMFDEGDQLQDKPTNTQTMMEVGDGNEESIAIAGEADANATVATKESTEATMGMVHWIGYVYKADESLVNVEIVTKNNPQFDIYQEVNRAKQKEIVVRYYNTKLRQKIRRDIDASEFRSPVAYIRTRDGDKKGVVEVVLTIRDEVETKYLAKDGSLLLSFPIPKRYFGSDKIAAEPSEQAVDLSSPLIVVKMDDSKDPRLGRVLGYVFNREVFKSINPDSMQELPDGSLSFNNTANEAEVDVSVNAVLAEDSDMMMDGSDNNEYQENFQENFQQNQQQNFQQNQQENFQQNQQQNFQQNQQENFQQNQQENFQQNQQQNFQQNSEGNFQENNEENSALRMQILDHLASSETIFMHVGQDPADNFSVPDDLSDGSKDIEGLPVANGSAAAGKDGNTTTSSAAVSNPANVSNFAGGNAELEMGQVDNGNIDNNANLEEALLDEDSLLAPLHGTEAIGQDGAAEDIVVSEAKAVRMVFRDAPLSEVLHAIRTETGTNFIFQPGIGARKIFLNLSNVPWDEALRALLEVNNLAMAKIGDNLVRIDTLAAIESYKKQMQSLKIQEGRMQPTKVMILKLSHAEPGPMKNMISKLLDKVMKEDDRIRVEVDTRTKSLLIEALPEDLAKIRVLVDRLDYRAPQVKIASRVVEVSKSTATGFGISWSGPINYNQSRGLGFGSLLFPNFATASFAVDAGGGSGPAGGPGGSIGVHFGSLNDSVALDLRLNMLEEQNVAEVLQTNNVVVQDGKNATITAGSTDVIITQGTGDQANSRQDVTYNVTLTVTPRITADNSVQMSINIDSRSPRQSSSAASFDQRSISTELLKQSGETIAIGGLYTLNKTKASSGVPILSSIPILGALFRSLGKSEARKELLFLVTPTILNSGKAGGDDDDFGDQGNVGGNLSNNIQQNYQFQQENQFQQDKNFDVDDINSENPSNAEWQANNDQFQQQQGQQGNQQNFYQNNEQLNNEQLNNEQLNNQENQEDDEEIDLNEQQNDDEQEQNALTIDQQQDLGDQF